MIFLQQVEKEIKLTQVALLLGIVASLFTIANATRQIRINQLVLEKMEEEFDKKKEIEKLQKAKQKRTIK